MSEPSLEELQDKLSAAVEVLMLDGDLSFKSMFGGISGYLNGRVFASLSNIGLALKLSAEDQVALLKQAGAKRLRYEPDAPESKQYIVVPEAIQDSCEALSIWVKHSVDYVLAQPAPKPKKKPV
jgi:TfoX/Sxy family transcriptional regulator of competence genes